jgi:hypothetical protein
LQYLNYGGRERDWVKCEHWYDSSQVGERGREICHWVIEFRTQDEVCRDKGNCRGCELGLC